MPLRADTTLLGRYRVASVDPPREGRVWASATDTAADAPLTLETVDRTARLRPGARERRALAATAPAHPALAPGQDLGEVEGAPLRAWAGTLRPWPAEARLGAADVSRTLAWLAPAVAAAGAALGGELDTRDLVLDADGVPRLAPSGVVRAASLARPDHHRPPPSGDPAADALYGLGVVLYVAATGQLPTGARTAAELARAQATPRRAASLQPDLPGSVAGALDALVSPDPAGRTALLGALPAVAPPRLRLPAAPAPAAPAPAAAPAVRTTGPTPERALRGWLVLARPAAATATARRRLAALADLAPAALEDAAAAGEEVPVRDTLRSEADARRAATDLAGAGVPLEVCLVPDAPTGRYVAAAGLGGAALLGGLGTLAMLPLGLGFALAAGLPATALLVGAVLLAARARRDGALLARLASAARRLDGAPALAGPAAAIQAARRAALEADLPTAALQDLLDAADDLDEALVGAGDADTAGLASAAAELAEAAEAWQTAPDGARQDTGPLDAAEGRARAAAAALKATAGAR